MSNAVGFLLIPFAAAIAGSILLWMWSRTRRPVEPDFQTRLRALSPDPESRPHPQPSGIVPIDDPPVEET